VTGEDRRHAWLIGASSGMGLELGRLLVKAGWAVTLSARDTGRLDQAAVKGMRKAELVPAVRDGSKVVSVKRISIKFDLEDWGE